MEYPSKFRAQYLMHWGAGKQRPSARRSPATAVALRPPLELSGVAMAACGAAGPFAGAPLAEPSTACAGSGEGAFGRAGRGGFLGGGASGAVRPMPGGRAGSADAFAGDAGTAAVGQHSGSGRAGKRIIIPHADEAGMEDDGLNFRCAHVQLCARVCACVRMCVCVCVRAHVRVCKRRTLRPSRDGCMHARVQAFPGACAPCEHACARRAQARSATHARRATAAQAHAHAARMQGAHAGGQHSGHERACVHVSCRHGQDAHASQRAPPAGLLNPKP